MNTRLTELLLADEEMKALLHECGVGACDEQAAVDSFMGAVEHEVRVALLYVMEEPQHEWNVHKWESTTEESS